MTNVHVHVPEQPFWDRDIYGSAMHNGVPVFSKLGRGPRGLRGEKGEPGADGNGEDGFSPWTEQGEDSFGNPTLVVHDRAGTHVYELSAQGGTIGPEALAKKFGQMDLWPKWYTYYFNGASTAATNATGDNNKQTWCYTSLTNFKRVNPTTGTLVTIANDIANLYPALYVAQYKFVRNGLEYAYEDTFAAGVSSSRPNIPMFCIGTEVDSTNNLYFKPKLESGHKLEDCQLSILVAPSGNSEI